MSKIGIKILDTFFEKSVSAYVPSIPLTIEQAIDLAAYLNRLPNRHAWVSDVSELNEWGVHNFADVRPEKICKYSRKEVEASHAILREREI